MYKDDKLLEYALWPFIIMMVIVLCLSASKERKSQTYIAELEQEVIMLEDQAKADHKTISDLQAENEMLEQSLEETLKMYNDAVDEAHDEELKSMSKESLYRSYKLEEGKEND